MRPVKEKKAKKSRSETPQKKTAPSPKPVKLADSNEKEHLGNIRALAELVKELLNITGGNIISSKGKKASPLVVCASKYINCLTMANCKVEMHHQLYRDLFHEHRVRLLKCIGNEAWMNKLASSVNVQLGVGTAFEKSNVTLKISVALSNALKLKDEIDNGKYENVNEREAAMGSYNYQYVPLFYFRLLTVIKDALGTKHEDVVLLEKIIDHYRGPAGLDSSDEGSEEPAGKSIADFVNNIAGDKNKIDSKGLVGALEKITSDTGLVGGITDAIKDMNSGGKKDKKSKEDAFVDMARKVGPVFTDLFEAVTGQGGDDSGSEESGDTDESSSE